MIIKKPELKKLSPQFGDSLMVEQHIGRLDDKPAFWHFHPEIELL